MAKIRAPYAYTSSILCEWDIAIAKSLYGPVNIATTSGMTRPLISNLELVAIQIQISRQCNLSIAIDRYEGITHLTY